MMFNKNQYRKANDTKVLHKVGKQWKVISVALLLALAGTGAVAMHSSANANADSVQPQQTSAVSANNVQSLGFAQSSSVNVNAKDIDGGLKANNSINSTTSEEAKSLEAVPSVAGPQNSASSEAGSQSNSNASAKSAQSQSSSAVNYDNDDAGSAASYRADAFSNKSAYNVNSAKVSSYVNSLNSTYSGQLNSYRNNIQSDSVQTNDDQSSANSYSAIANQNNYSQGLSARAAKSGLTTSAYIQGVGISYRNKKNNAKHTKSFANQMNTVNSYAQLINNISTKSDVSEAYQIDAASADAVANVAHAKLDAATQILSAKENENNHITTNNVNFYQMSAADQIALDNSAEDAKYVNSLAHSLGYSNSYATSSAVMSYANSFNNKVANSSVAFKDASNSSVNLNVSSAGLRQVLSDTDAMAHFGNINKEDYIAVRSAQDAVNSLTNTYDAASESASAADVLGDHPTMENLFGSVASVNVPSGLKNVDPSIFDIKNGKGLKFVTPSVIKDVKNYSEASNAVKGMNASAISSATSSADDAAASASTDVSDYATNADAAYVLAPELASSEANDVNKDKATVKNDINQLKDFYTTHADADSTQAFNAMQSAKSNYANESTLSNAFGTQAYNYVPKLITTTKTAQLHSTPKFGEKNDSILGKVARGSHLSVQGIGIAPNGNMSYLVTYNGATGYITHNTSFTRGTYLDAKPGNHVSVQLIKKCSENNSSSFNKDTFIKNLPAGTKVSGKVVSMDGIYGGFTRIQLDNGNWITSNIENVTPVSANGNSDFHFAQVNY